MIINLKTILSLAPVRGVIHIGAHHGWEYPHYKAAGIENIVMVEPHPESFSILQGAVGPECVLFNTALGSSPGHATMHVERANMGQSNSLLRPSKHLLQYPHITFDSCITVPVSTLDDLPIQRDLYNMLNIDVQGYELEVLKGGLMVLTGIDAVYCEVNRDEVYEGCARVEQIDQLLANAGFRRELTDWAGGSWGDALYLR